MDRDEVVSRLDALGPRPAGSEAERLGARELAAALGAGGRSVTVEPAWVRPRWELALALYAALGVVGSVVAVGEPWVGLALAAVALLALTLDVRGWFALRWLTPERATQNVVAAVAPAGPGPAAPDRGTSTSASMGRAERGTRISPPAADLDSGTIADGARVVRLIVTAHLDTLRGGLLRTRGLRRLDGGPVGPLAWVALALAGVAACAAVRVAGGAGAAVGVAQLVPTLVLIFALGLLLDGALARPVAGDATAAAVVVALCSALDATPPRRLAVDVVIAGAGEAQALGFRAFLRALRPPRDGTIVLEVTACRNGPPRWWTSDGPLLPLRFDPRLIALAGHVAAEERHLRARPHRSRQLGAALRARQRRLPAIRIGCDESGRGAPAPPEAARADPAAMTATLELALALIHALDAELGS